MYSHAVTLYVNSLKILEIN